MHDDIDTQPGIARCSPGSHPHSDQPNWRPAETFEDYLSNCREGLEEYSDRRAAVLRGTTRIELWRWQMMAAIPDDLFDRLLHGCPELGAKGLAQIGQALSGGRADADAECCPHCGGVVRFRPRVGAKATKIIADWIAERDGGAP